MASNFSEPSEQHPESKEKLDTMWSCDMHSKPIKFFCEYHVIALCDQCAAENHEPCTPENIEDLLNEMKTDKEPTCIGVEEANNLLCQLDARIQSCKKITDSRLASIRKAVENAYDDQIEREMSIKGEQERMINEEADGKIRIINEEREERLRYCCRFADKQMAPLKQQKREILEDISSIEMRLNNLEKEFEGTLDKAREKSKKIRGVIKDDRYLMRNARKVLELLRCLHDEDGCESAGRLEHTLDGLRFVKGYINSSFCGRLEYPSGQWKLIKTIEVKTIKNPVKVPKFVGLVGYDSIAVMNHDPNDRGLYVIDLTQGTSTRVLEGKPDTYFVSCSSIDRKRVACGKSRKECTGDILEDCITIHDENWNQIRTIPVPRNVSYNYAYVDVDPNGKILAALYGQSNIYVINPADGEIEDTISFTGKEVRGRIHALSSGSVIARSGECEVTIIARNGETKSFTYDEGDFSLFRSETLNDTIYVTNWNKRSCRCTVGQMSSNGVIQAKGIVGYKDPSVSFYRSACLVTPSGKLVLCDEQRILVYKKVCVL